MTPPLFRAGDYAAAEVEPGDVPALQRFFEANPEYFRIVLGEPPGPGVAREEFESRPPPDWPWSRRWMLAFVDREGAMAGVADVVSDLLAERVWHVGLFVVASGLHGTGAARGLYEALEGWMREGGARWLRLNVVEGNLRAERFWMRRGFRPLRLSRDVPVGPRRKSVLTLAKPLEDDGLEEYLAHVARDRPESA